MPISSAAPLSSDTARIALPTFVFPVNSVRPIMMTMFASTVKIVSLVMISVPPKSEIEPTLNTEVKFFGVDPQISSATFCKR